MQPTGQVIEGTDAHIEFLTNWFAAANPKWKTSYLIENEYTNKDGELRQWVTSGHSVTLTVEGEEVKLGQVHDALIVDGKSSNVLCNRTRLGRRGVIIAILKNKKASTFVEAFFM